MEINLLIIILSSLNMMFIWMHELDACYLGEWRMLSFLRKFKEEVQYRVFLLMHIPLFMFSIYYLWTVFQFSSFPLWVVWNVAMIVHLSMHIHAKKWSRNVFQSSFSFVFIYGAAITSFINLFFIKYY